MLHSPTGYYALITTARHITGPDGTEVEEWSVTETYPVVSFQSGESMIVNRAGEVHQAKEFAQGVLDGLNEDKPDGVRFAVGLDVTPHHTEGE